MEYAIAGIVGFVGGISGIAVYTYIKSRTPSKKKTTSNNQKLVKIEKLKDNTAKKIPNGSESPSKSSESRRKSETAQKSSPGQRKSRNRPSEATIYGIGQLQNPKSEIPEPESSRNKKADSADELTDNTLNKIRKELAQSSDLYTTGEQTVEPTAMFTTNVTLFNEYSETAMSLPGYLATTKGLYQLNAQTMGQGGGGEIYFVESFKPVGADMNKLFMNQKLVAKRMKSSEMDEFVQEVATMALFIQNPYFAQLVAYDEAEMILFLIYYPLGSLKIWLKKQSTDLKNAYYIIYGTCKALKDLHQFGIVHNDIKPANILLNEENGIIVPKLTDFGISNVVENQVIKVKAFRIRNTRGISIPYAAPERLNAKLINNPAHARKAVEVAKSADIYSLNVKVEKKCFLRRCSSHQLVKEGSSLASQSITVSDYVTGLDRPYGLAVDSLGNLYVNDLVNGLEVILAKFQRKLSITKLSGSAKGSIDVDADGNIYVAVNNTVKKINTKGQISDIGSGFLKPNAVAVDKNGNIFVADAFNNGLKKISASNGLTSLVGTFYLPMALDTDGYGNVYVSEYKNFSGAIKRVDTTGKVVSFFHGITPVNALSLDPQRNIYAALNNGQIIRYTNGIAYILTFLPGAVGIAVDRTGKILYISNGSKISKIDLPPIVWNVTSNGQCDMFHLCMKGLTCFQSSCVVLLNGACNATLKCKSGLTCVNGKCQ